MQGWIVVAAWCFAALFAIVLLSFAIYEINWKLRRLNTDRDRLTQLAVELAAVGEELQTAAERLR